MVLFRRLLGDVLRAERMRRGMTLRDVSAAARVSPVSYTHLTLPTIYSV